MDKHSSRFIIILSLAALFFSLYQSFVGTNKSADVAKATKQEDAQSFQTLSRVNRPVPQFSQTYSDLLSENKVIIKNKKLIGAISKVGLTLFNVQLLNHKVSIDPHSNKVSVLNYDKDQQHLLSMEFSCQEQNIQMPSANTVWRSDKDALYPDDSVTFVWKNNIGIEFQVKMTMDDDYMIFVQKSIINKSQKDIHVSHSYKISKLTDNIKKKKSIFNALASNAHDVSAEQILGSINSTLEEYKYDKIVDNKQKDLRNVNVSWIGNNSKYWMCSVIPNEGELYDVSFDFQKFTNKSTIYLVCTNMPSLIKAGNSVTSTSKIFCGAKEIELLARYKKTYKISLFDRSIDFGMLHFITKPLFYPLFSILNFFNGIVKNFGVSIILLTIFIRLILLPLLRKSEVSMQGIKNIQPKINELRKRYSNNSDTLRRELLSLYKREKVNPWSFSAGCLPMLFQIPIWLSLYTLIQCVIDFRHASFCLWVKDLSAPDHLYLLNLFGLIDLNLPSFLQIGIMPVLCGLSLFLQQSVVTTHALDPIQQRMFKLLPIFCIFFFASSSVGLLIYWTMNNILSILQHYVIRYYSNKQR